MSLISTKQLHAVLREELGPSGPGSDRKDSLGKLLENSNLTAPEVLENLSSLLRSGETDGVRLRAAETALKLNGLLDADSNKPDFSVTINIIDTDFSVNPILIPRS